MPGKTRSRVLVLLGGLALAGLLAGLCEFAWRSPSGTVVLTDGTRVRVLGVSRGGEFFTTEKPWHKLARKVLPTKWQGWLPKPYSAWATGASNNLTIWFSLADAMGTNLTVFPWHSYFTLAEDGSRVPPRSLSGRNMYSTVMAPLGASRAAPAPPPTVYSMSLSVFPRRQRELTLLLVDGNGRSLGSIRVRNPFRGPFPEWAPEPLPVTHTNGPLSVTLTNLLRVSSPQADTFILLRQSGVESPDAPWRDGFLLSEVWSDATGNSGRADTILPRTERAWKLDLWYRLYSPTNSAAEKFLLPALPVPGPRRFQVLTNEFGQKDWKIRVRCVAGPGSALATNGMLSTTWTNSNPSVTLRSFVGEDLPPPALWPSRPFFLVECSPPLLQELESRVIEPDTGKSQVASKYGFDIGGGRQCLVHFDPPEGTNSVVLEISVNPVRHFEFFVDPAKIQDSAAFWQAYPLPR